ncbi:MAG: DUF4321 domain-containing protein [Clostridiales bacterium]|nr:DUF4321 domain-containing protein [Clostridiales bacterium]
MTKTKNTLILVFLVLAAIVLAALVGQLTSGVEFLKWLTWGESIGFDTVNLNLSIIQLSFSFKMQVNVLQVLLIAAALLLYKKIK